MSDYEAAVLLVSMVSDLRMSGYDDPKYHEAVAIACGVLMKSKEQLAIPNELNYDLQSCELQSCELH